MAKGQIVKEIKSKRENIFDSVVCFWDYIALIRRKSPVQKTKPIYIIRRGTKAEQKKAIDGQITQFGRLK